VTLVSPVAPRNWHARTVLVSALRADGEPSRFVRSGEHTAFPGRRTTRCRGLSRSPERNLDIHGLNHRHLVIRIQCGQLAGAPALRYLPAVRPARAALLPWRPVQAGGPRVVRSGRSARPASTGGSRDRDALICVSRPAVKAVEAAAGEGRLAQRESASFTPRRSLVRSQYRPPGQELLGRARMHVRANRSGTRVRLLSMVPV
jgi:hypothetical protein